MTEEQTAELSRLRMKSLETGTCYRLPDNWRDTKRLCQKIACDLVEKAIKDAGGNMTQACKNIGMPRRQMQRLVAKYELSRKGEGK